MMVSGQFPLESFRDLRARISWDRIHNRLAALPGTARLALTNGGTIPETGQFPVYLGHEGPRLGELDEEFVFERRVGETFVLGTATWRIDAIEPHRVVVGRAEGRPAQMPFWRGEKTPRSAALGEAVGALCRTVAARLDDPALIADLRSAYRLDSNAAQVLRNHIARQVRVAGTVPDDRTVLVESYRDPSGEMGLALLTPFGGKLHQALKLAIGARLRQRFGLSAACLHGDEGLLFRLPQLDDPPLDILTGLSADLAETLVRDELADSALFGLRFRQNAGRALLMPRPDPSKRTPLWLQRLRAKDLLQVVRAFPKFPIVVETYRECLQEDLDLPRLRSFLDGIGSGAIRVATRRGEVPSPFVSDLILRFQMKYLYEWDEPKRADRAPTREAVDDELLNPLLGAGSASLWLDPAAVGQVDSRLRGRGRPPRTTEEMAVALKQLGDLSQSELSGPMLGFLTALEREGRAATITLERTREPDRWISSEELPLYREVFPDGQAERIHEPSDALGIIVRRFLQTHALIGVSDLTARYPIGPGIATELLERWTDSGGLVRIEETSPEAGPRWAEGRNLAEIRRLSIAIRRRESIAVAPEVFADFLLRHQHVEGETSREGSALVERVLHQLQGFAAPAELWESELLPARVRDYRPAWLDDALTTGDWMWRALVDGQSDLRVAFFSRASEIVPCPEVELAHMSETAHEILATLSRMGASFATDLARDSGREPSRVRSALDELTRHGLATNDRFDPLRPGARAIAEALAGTARSPRARRPRVGQIGPGRLSRRPASGRPEGRWSRIDADRRGTASELRAQAWASVLIERYGVLTRETAALDPWAPPWRELVVSLSRAELRGEVRRGYFVEGLSGVQYATSEAADALADRAADRAPRGQPVLISTLDPANLYGAGAPFDIDLLEGGTARLPRSTASFLVLFGGRPALIIEAHGKRLTGLASASEAELRAAVAVLPRLARPSRRVIRAETYNGVATLESPAAPWLAEAGFVRDYPGMAFYAGW
jgi:ATP-dependent Lhr-like helicase